MSNLLKKTVYNWAYTILRLIAICGNAAHTDVFSLARGLNFSLDLRLDPYFVYAQTRQGPSYDKTGQYRDCSGRVLDSRPRGRGFEPHRRHCVVVIEQETFYPSLVLVQPRKTRPCLNERLLMGRKESNQSNKQTKTGQ